MSAKAMNPVQIPQAKGIVIDTTGAEIVAEDSPATRDSRGIYLPHYIEPVSHIAIDIGGSLAKVVYFTRSPNPPNGHSRVPGLKTNDSSSPPHAGLSGEGNASSSSHAYAGHAGGETEDGSAASAAAHASSSTSSWQPVINGALTPDLLTSQRQEQRLRGRDLAAHVAGSLPVPLSAEGAAAGDSHTSDDLPSSPVGQQATSTTSTGSHRRQSSSASGSGVVVDTGGGSRTARASQPTASSSSTSRVPRQMTPRSHAMLRRTSLPPNFPGGTLNFARFETEKIEDMVAFLKNLISVSASTNHVTEEQMKRGVKVLATGGGAHKYHELLSRELGVPVEKEDEMECLITGLGFITCIPDETFWYSDELVYTISHPTAKEINGGEVKPDTLPRPSPEPPNFQVTFDTAGAPQFPCLLVNIGSGVSIIKVDEDGSFERVSGTSLGGGTLWGLLSLMTDASTFDEMLTLSEQGDNAACDMLVGDIYGSDYSKVGLKSSTIASSFGKVFKKGNGLNAGERRQNFRQEDISRSLLYAISNNIGQIAYMNAEKYGLDRIYFGGCFIRGHAATISTLSYAIRFWSRNTVRAMFLRHEGFLGSIGAWIKNVKVPADQMIQQS